MTEIGPTLREARMRARIDITEVERATKIRTKYLRALEDEEWGVLPGATFAKSFLRTYAEYLGLDARLLVEEFKRRYDRPAEVELAPRGAKPAGRREGRSPGGGRRREWLLVVAVLALVLAGLFAIGKLGGSNDKGSTGVSAQTQTQTRTTGKRRKPRKRAPARPATARVELTPTSAVYVCAVGDRGRKLLGGVTLPAGGPPRVLTGRRILLTLGNAGVRMKVNGKPVTVPSSSTPLSYVVTPAGRRALPAAQAPSCT